MQWKKFTERTDGSGIIRTRDDGNTQTENDETAMTMSFFTYGVLEWHEWLMMCSCTTRVCVYALCSNREMAPRLGTCDVGRRQATGRGAKRLEDWHVLMC